MKLDLVIRELHRSETLLLHRLTTMADRHQADHEIHHVARDLTTWSREHIAALADTGRRYGLDLADQVKENSWLVNTVRDKLSEWFGRRSEPALLLLADLRELHRMAVGVSLDWELLGQAAQAARDADLLTLSQRCHPRTLRQMRWANAMLKMLSPQTLTS